MQEEEIPVVIGSYTTAITLPMAKETLLSNKTILISPRANGEEIYGFSPRFYQINPPIHALSNFISEWVKYSSDRTAVIYVDDTYGRSLLNQIKSSLSNNSISLSGSFPVTSENTDYLAFSQNILDIAPDTIVISVYDNRQIPIISNLSEAGFRGQIILTESSLLDTLDEEIPDDIARFALFSISSYTNLVPGEESDQFVSTFQSTYGEDPSRTLAGYGYDSLMVIDNAIRLVKKGNETISTDLIQKGIENSRYYGVTGPKTFDSHNAAGAAMDRWGFQNGSFELMTISLI
jgi:ABC-type branched-subunit amino acid transport system substrate-binding protein